MRVWTDGTRHLLLDQRGLCLYEEAQVPKRIHGNGLQDTISRGHLAANSQARVALSATEPRLVGPLPEGGYLTLPAKARVDWIDGLRRTQDVPPTSLAMWGDADVLGVITRGAGAQLVTRSVESIWTQRRAPSDWDAQARFIDLPEPRRVAWPTGRAGSIWTQEPWSRTQAPSGDWQFETNEHGVVGVDRQTGIVVLLGVSPSDPVHALRIPVEFPETTIDVVATAQGILVGHGGGRGKGAVNHFARDGKHLSGLVTSGIATPVAVTGGDAYFATARSEGDLLEVWIIDLQDGNVRERIETGLSATAGCACIASAEGVVVVGDGNSVRCLRRDAHQIWRAAVLPEGPRDDRHEEPSTKGGTPVPAEQHTRETKGPQRVHHAKFGDGTVRRELGQGQDAELEVAFDTGETRVLRARFVKPLG